MKYLIAVYEMEDYDKRGEKASVAPFLIDTDIMKSKKEDVYNAIRLAACKLKLKYGDGKPDKERRQKEINSEFPV